MKRNARSLFRRTIAIGLSAMLLIGAVPATSYAEDTASHKIYTKKDGTEAYIADVDGKTYISDSNTINGWKNYFTDITTEYAGAVWTDKAVFTNNTATTAIPSDFTNLNKEIVETDGFGAVVKDANGNIQMTTQPGAYDVTVADENFLVSMSALGSTKQITGYSALPSDTVFILDVSNSMESQDLAKMVEATNKAIDQLLALNNHNRVGVVVYGTSAYTLLEIDRYTTTETEDNGTTATEDDYSVYIEISSTGSGYGQSRQIVTARTTEIKTETTTLPVNTITDNTWTRILGNMPEGDDYRNSSSFREAVANYLERVLSTTVVGFDIDWEEEIDALAGNGPGRIDLRKWDANDWRPALEQIISDNSTISTTTTTTNGNLKGSDGNEVVASVNIGGATYLQGGINQALQLFKAMEGDTSIDTGLIQGGTARLPIAVLMTDGAPTYASVDYTNAGNGKNDLGAGGDSSINDNLVFPTQLSAAYLKQQMEKIYGRESFIYSLGLGIEYAEAHRVLNPSYYTSDAIEAYWDNDTDNNGYANTAQGSEIGGYSYRNGYGQTTYKITRLEDVDNSLEKYRYYVNEYFSASVASDLVGAFDKIVEAIIIQSKYYPTLVESGAHDFDGYLTFEDELGEFMEVKDMKGIVLGNTIYTGDAFLYALNKSDAFGNASTWTACGEELLKSISERIGIAENEARSLLAAAYRAGGTKADGTPVNQTGQLWDQNYIGWYADAQGNYLEHWDDELHTEANYPENAAYLNKCYIFQGDLSAETTSVNGGDMMHIVVQVHEEIATGHQSVIWEIPANLIPLVTYDITVDSNSLDTAENITVKVETEEPIRLLYEVGLDDKINDVNMADVVARAHHSHPVKDSNNNVIGYAFYSNRWGEGHTLDGSGHTNILDPTSHLAAVAHFHPSHQNERYYYTEDSILYVESSTKADTYEVYKGNEKPSGNDFWHIYRIIRKVGNAYEVYHKPVPVAADVLSATGDLAITKITDTNDVNYGAWYVPAGQIYQQLVRHRQEKDDPATNENENYTATLAYTDYPVVVHGLGDDYDVYNFLGNNGRLVKYSATGIKLTKTIDDTTAPGTVDFTFEIELEAPNGETLQSSYPTVKTAVDGTQTTGTVNVVKGKITASIKNGESLHIIGLADSTTYTVSEQWHANYAVKEVKLNNAAVAGITVTDTTKQYVIDAVEFINTKSTHKGDLEITKTVTHPYGNDYIINSELDFDVVVDLGAANAGESFAATGTVTNGEPVTGTLLADAQGKITLKLGHEDSVTIYGIPEGTAYKVTEPNVTSPWEKTEAEGTILSDRMVEANLVNNLKEISDVDTSNISIEITKNISGVTDWDKDWTFDFIVERYNPDLRTENKWENILNQNEVFTISGTDADKTITVAGKEGDEARQIFGADKLGRHYYRITEKEGSISGITYDTTHRYFYLEVTDTNTDGKLEIKAVNYSGTTVTEDSNGNFVVAANFTNYYDSAVANITLEKSLNNNTGVEIKLEDFDFKFCTANHAGSGTCTGSCQDLDVNPDGKLTISKAYTATDLAGIDWTYVDPTTKAESTYPDNASNIPEGATKSKTYTYYLWEDGADAIVGMAYDTSVYQVDVVVTVTREETTSGLVITHITAVPTITKIVDGDGDNVDESGSKPSIATFSNTYTLEETTPVIALGTKKTLEGGRNMIAGEFSFSLYKANSAFQYNESSDLVDSDSVAAGTNEDTVLLDLPKYSSAGRYYYVLRETVGTNAAITYDPTVYHIMVEVGAPDTLDSDNVARLKVKSVTINEIGGAIATYNGPFTGTEPFVITGTETPAAGTAVPLAFVNTYNVRQGVTVTINGDKDLDGKTLMADEYEFGLYKVESGTETLVDTVKNIAVSGGFTFDLSFDKAEDLKEHTYLIREIKPSPVDNNVTYDESEYQVVIDVTDVDGNGTFESDWTMTCVKGKDGSVANELVTDKVAKYTNTYTYDDSAIITFTGTKEYVKHDNTQISITEWPTEGFEFKLYEADSNFKIQGDGLDTVKAGEKLKIAYKMVYNNATKVRELIPNVNKESVAGNSSTKAPFELAFTYQAPGSYYYVLREVEGTTPSVRYDTKEYQLTVIVTDYDGSGTLTVTKSMTYGGAKEDVAEFTNVHVKQTVDVEVPVRKELENTSGIEILLNTFRFGLFTDSACTTLATLHGEAMISTAASNGDASFELHYDNDDLIGGNTTQTYTYYAKEIYDGDGDGIYNEPDDKVAGMTYDASIYKVEVTLKYENDVLIGYDTITQIVGADGKPIAAADQVTDADNTMTFRNKFDPEDAKIIITGTKSLTGRAIVDGEFAFALHEATVTKDSQGVITGWTTENQIGNDVANTGSTFSFPEITYSAIGTHYYVIKEVIPNAAGNITYDNNEYLLEVEVINGGAGALLTTSKVLGKGYDDATTNQKVYTWATVANPLSLTIENEFTVTFSIGGKKEITNRDWSDTDTFTFNLYETAADFTMADDAVPKATDTIKGTDADKAFNFTDVKLDGVGIHYFVIREATGNAEYMSYDASEYRVTVEVVDNLDGTVKVGRYAADGALDPGQLPMFIENEFEIQKAQETTTLLFLKSMSVVDKNVAMDEIVFVNEYQTNPVAVTISGTKTLTANASDRELKDDEFTFELYTATVSQEAGKNNLIWTVASDSEAIATNKDGVFTFMGDLSSKGGALTFAQAGDYYYVVKETAGTNAIVTYDDTEHKVKVKVTDMGDTDGDGKANLKAEVFYMDEKGAEAVLKDQIAFKNSYNDTKVVLNIAKTVKNTGSIVEGKDGFEFRLENVTTGEVYKTHAVSDNDGNTSFTILYDEDDIGETYTYKITEVNTGIKDMVYDSTVYTVKVTLSVENSQLKAAVVLDGKSVDNVKVHFNNTYNGTVKVNVTPTPKPETPGTTVTIESSPKTGDDFNLALYGGLMAAGVALVTAVLIAKRKKQNKM